MTNEQRKECTVHLLVSNWTPSNSVISYLIRTLNIMQSWAYPLGDERMRNIMKNKTKVVTNSIQINCMAVTLIYFNIIVITNSHSINIVDTWYQSSLSNEVKNKQKDNYAEALITSIATHSQVGTNRPSRPNGIILVLIDEQCCFGSALLVNKYCRVECGPTMSVAPLICGSENVTIL